MKPPQINTIGLDPLYYFWLDSREDLQFSPELGSVLTHIYRDVRDNQLWAIHEFVDQKRFGEWFRVRSRSVTVYEPMETR